MSENSGKTAGSFTRVVQAANSLGLDIEVLEMDQSTRTAQEAAQACKCTVGQIVKSLVFERSDNRRLVLVLVSGANNADLEKLKVVFSTKLERADPRKIREVTGFAIGGVSPIGHLVELETVIDQDLTGYTEVWAAAGKPNAVFKVGMNPLLGALGCEVVDLKTA